MIYRKKSQFPVKMTVFYLKTTQKILLKLYKILEKLKEILVKYEHIRQTGRYYIWTFLELTELEM